MLAGYQNDSLAAFVDYAYGAVVALNNLTEVVTGSRFFSRWCKQKWRFFVWKRRTDALPPGDSLLQLPVPSNTR